MAEQKKIYLWSIPRSISTAMVRAMMSRENCRVSLQDEVLSKSLSYNSLNLIDLNQKTEKMDTYCARKGFPFFGNE